MSVIEFSVHKNTAMRRRQREMRRDMLAKAKRASQIEGIEGYAVVTWAKGGQHLRVHYDSGNLPPLALPNHVESAIRYVQSKDE